MIGRCGSSMLKPSPNHGTLWLHNDDDDDDEEDDDDDDDDDVLRHVKLVHVGEMCVQLMACTHNVLLKHT